MVSDVTSAGTAIAKRFAQRRNVHPEGGLFNDSVGPSPRDQLLFRDCIAGALGQRSQNIERATAEAHRFPVYGQHPLGGDQPERSEGEDFFIHRGIVLRGFFDSYRLRTTFASPVERPRRRSTDVPAPGFQPRCTASATTPWCTRPTRLSQAIEQRSCRSQVGRVEPLCEAVVDRLENPHRSGGTPLIAPQPGEAGRDAQLPRKSAVAARPVEGASEILLGIGDTVRSISQ
jgi:hypothetical protein